MALNGVTWAELAQRWAWGALAAHEWYELLPFPSYRVRAGFVDADWGEVASAYGWAQLASAFAWEEIEAGPLSAEDVRALRIERRAADLFERLSAGRADLVLENAGAAYSPEQAGGPYVLKVGDALAVKAVTEQGSVYGLFSGHVERYGVNPAPERRTTHLQAADRARLLKRSINLGLRAEAPVGSLFAEVLSTAGVAPEYRAVAGIADRAPYAFLDNLSGGDAFDRLLRTGAHHGYVSGAGRITVRGRNFDLLATSVASYADFAALGFALADERVVNDARVSGEPREATGVSTIAWLDETQTLAAGAGVSFVLGFLDPETRERATPAMSLVAPDAGTDYALAAAPDGTGADLSSGAVVSLAAFATSALVTVTNANAGPAYLTRFQLRGVPLRRKPAFIAQAEGASSQAVFGRRTLAIESDMIGDVLKAADYAAYLVDRFAEPAGDLAVAIKNRFPDVLARELLERVTLVESHTGVASDYVIEGLAHTVSFERGVEHVLEMSLHRAAPKAYLVLDSDPAGRIDAARTLGF
ncbi:MAG: hypothetical protein HY521_14960 [Proteobacteria bacterium]|nr:hypothetical protein [Pseudomonadota bacterium]